MHKLTGALNTSKTTLTELSPRDQLETSLGRRLAFLKRNQLDPVVQRLQNQRRQFHRKRRQSCARRSFAQSGERFHGNRSFGTEELSPVIVVSSGLCGSFHRAQKFGTNLEFSASLVHAEYCGRFYGAPNLAVRCSGVDFEKFKNARGCQLEKCGVARAVEPIHSESSSHGPDGCELGHTLQSATLLSSRHEFLPPCLCSCAWVSRQRPSSKEVKDTFRLLRQVT